MGIELSPWEHRQIYIVGARLDINYDKILFSITQITVDPLVW